MRPTEAWSHHWVCARVELVRRVCEAAPPEPSLDRHSPVAACRAEHVRLVAKLQERRARWGGKMRAGNLLLAGYRGIDCLEVRGPTDTADAHIVPLAQCHCLPSNGTCLSRHHGHQAPQVPHGYLQLGSGLEETVRRRKGEEAGKDESNTMGLLPTQTHSLDEGIFACRNVDGKSPPLIPARSREEGACIAAVPRMLPPPFHSHSYPPTHDTRAHALPLYLSRPSRYRGSLLRAPSWPMLPSSAWSPVPAVDMALHGLLTNRKHARMHA